MDSITNDTIIFGLLASVLALVFYTQKHKRFQAFYSVIPAVLLCYLLPAILVYLKVIDPSESKLYFVASRYLLPAALVLMTLSVDLKAVLRLGPKALIMFFYRNLRNYHRRTLSTTCNGIILARTVTTRRKRCDLERPSNNRW